VQLESTRLSNESRKPEGYRTVVIDISDRKSMEKEREQMQNHLRQIHKMESIGTLAGGIAHDFNNILSSIYGYSQLLEMHIDEPEKAKKYIAQLFKGAQRASGLVQQILTFSKQSECKKHPLYMFILLKEALKLLRSTIPSSIEFKENIYSKAAIMADTTQIYQVIVNLCTNAYHAMGDTGGVLMVELNETEVFEQESMADPNRLPGKYLELKVSDTGYGIEEKIMERIFDPYFTTKGMGKGSGLGLAMVDGIVKGHNGFIK